MINTQLFYELHKNLIIKAIEELQFEELFNVEFIDDRFYFRINDSIYYSFHGRIGAWGNLQIDKSTFHKVSGEKVIVEFTLADFFYETQYLTKMSDETLAQFIEEGNQTIYGDILHYHSLENLSLNEIAQFNFNKIDQILSGHPKIIMNKGRLGWGSDELLKYAPETRNSYKLHWCAIKKEYLELGLDQEQLNLNDLYKDSLSISEVEFAKGLVHETGANSDDFVFIPVHPWQWSKYISVQFAHLIYQNALIPLGIMGREYTPQVSIRTLSSNSRESKFDLKVAISILNTSSVRGISQKYISKGHLLSQKVESIIKSDSFLADKVDILKEVAAMSCPLPEFNRIDGGSYRYKELLGCVWRESVENKIADDELAIPTAALLFTKDNQSLVSEYIKLSGLGTKEWLKEYFEVVVIPLYHLQVEHGLGLVAHGQNTILTLKGARPNKLIIKDFHGDFRMASDSKHSEADFGVELDKLPPEYLIHDLITGHFITVLRYFSRVVEECLGFKEKDFYHLLGEVVANYQVDCSPVGKVNLLRNEFEKVLVNTVRFVAGYSETGERLKPMLGSNIKNPLVKNS
ncbi:IucA/IucC family protein [Halobacteriovorax sp. RT-2-4]|uniref:IucA/IucC family protein n=1 Tax=unclassified Halobacteriovorax TaxID=2639665 RepID=UPI003999A4F7